ncbi:thioredoxin family protein [Brochothrix thermosphacta]|uniref:Thioredoxin n=1 Tax=Brochothrix thermosphacta TaxID=2756 RepID=A0A1D2KBJ1_BROTH|nr:thioredoxin family protein [Brochothrix thermosphacta]ATF25597.1 thioredoxin [Brochothrix thermosphacta]ATH84931.1 thioredoxin [Brochothrix thermosphacta]MPQ28257.1 thioredoxin [Brochothrix thermosphacta]ODJ48736.1 hypothetical protein BFR38_05620 [Brochothrix thermosphacta]ODJ55069.1 hypothetical protein BFR42_06665 [Brochothrix thermosphacta]
MINKIKWWMIIVVAILVIGSGVLIFKPFATKEMDTSTFKAITTTEFETMKESKDGFVVYIGRPTCKYCRAFTPKLAKIAKDKKLTVYYYDTDKARKSDDKSLTKLLNNLDVSSVPTLMVIKDNKKQASFNAADKSATQTEKWLDTNKLK